MDELLPRRTMRLVCMLPTGSGLEVTDRRAAAAAAEERPLLVPGREAAAAARAATPAA